MTRLADYVLRLAEDQNEASEFATSKKTATELMKAAGLNDHQQRILLEGNAKHIGKVIAEELDTSSKTPFNHTTVMFSFDIPRPEA